MDFPRLSREYAGDGASLLLVPAWDFDLDGWLHARMAVLRGVENGFAIARAARNGLLTLSDSRGRIRGEKSTVPGQFVSLSGKLNVAREKHFTRTPATGLPGSVFWLGGAVDLACKVSGSTLILHSSTRHPPDSRDN